MRALSFFAALLVTLPNSPASSPQTTSSVVQRDPQALAVLQNSLNPMGGTVPSDSAAAGAGAEHRGREEGRQKARDDGGGAELLG